jgi:hypothetical protein
MPLRIQIVPSVTPTPEVVSPAVVRQWARTTGNQAHQGHQVAGITVPAIRIDQTQLAWEQRRMESGGIEFRFQDGTLNIQTSHRIYMASTLTRCERQIWAEHERDHVRDNHQAAGTLGSRIEADPTLQAYFVSRQWFDREMFGIVQQSIEDRVTAIFRELNAAAVRRRDTASEYSRVEQRIRAECGASRRRHRQRMRSPSTR